ncbi:MAG: hypothetical protein K6T91_09725 [Firmicutes bacterium]|nr:hypothetical protein [Bacillota bacterium]
MAEAERKPEARAVPETGMAPREEMGAVYPMFRGGYVPAWYSRLSWGSIFAGVFVAIATELVIAALVTLIGLAAVDVTNLAGLRNILTNIGIWTAIGALIALFVGAFVTSRLAMVQYISDGIWHGVTVWAFSLVAGILLSSLGITGILGFGTNIAAFIRGILPAISVTPADVSTLVDVTAAGAGWFLLAALLSLGTAILGGWLGSRRLSRSQAMERAERERMAA